jgi:tripartite-type tricarboxylate transporter receptor subunit TctC
MGISSTSTFSRRKFLAATGAISIAAGSFARESYPNRTVKLVVPYAAGGGPDVLTRRSLPTFTHHLGQTVFVENRVGAAGIVAAEAVAQAPADGYTVLLGASTHVSQKILVPGAKFDPVASFTHVCMTSTSPSVLVVSADSPYQTIDDLLRAANQRAGGLNYGSGGVATPAHLLGAAIAADRSLPMVHIPYKGSVDVVPAVLSGDCQFAIPTISTAMPLYDQKKIRILAISSSKRYTRLPDVPTLREAMASEDYVLEAWSGFWLPAGAPEASVKRWFEASHAVYRDAELIKLHETVGVSISLSQSPAEFSELIKRETAKYNRLIKSAKITIS